MDTIIILIFLFILLFLVSYFGIKLFMKMAKKAGKDSKDIFICPKCGSTSFSTSSKALSGTGLSFRGVVSSSNKFICNECDYEGVFPIIDKKGVKEYRKSKDKNAGDGI